MANAVETFSRGEAVEQDADALPQTFAISFGAARRGPFSLANAISMGLIGRIGRQEAERGAALFDSCCDVAILVARESVHDDDVAGPQLGDKKLLTYSVKIARVIAPSTTIALETLTR